MSLVNFIIGRYGPGIVFDVIERTYPPLLTAIDASAEHSLPDVLDLWADAHKTFMSVAKMPDIDRGMYRHRFLTETPMINVVLDLLHDLGIDVDGFVQALIDYKVKRV